jgi:hypothetical protein
MAEIIADYGFQATSEKRCEKSGQMLQAPPTRDSALNDSMCLH